MISRRSTEVEPWLRGPLPGVAPLLMPAAHALTQSAEDVRRAIGDLSAEQLWRRPPGSAPALGFHLRHIAGSLDRLLTYAAGEALSDEQFNTLAAESSPGEPPAEADELLEQMDEAVGRALRVMKRPASVDELLAPRAVGRSQLPTTLVGLLFHLAEHTQRHAGQIIATAAIVRGLGPAEFAPENLRPTA